MMSTRTTLKDGTATATSKDKIVGPDIAEQAVQEAALMMLSKGMSTCPADKI